MEIDEWAIILLTGIVSLFTSIVTSRITLTVTHKNEIRKHILEERTKFYFEIFPVIDILINAPGKVFDYSYMEKFISYKARMKLLASKKVFMKYQKLFDYVIQLFNFYDIYEGYNSSEPCSFDEDNFSKLDKEDLKLTEAAFQQKYLPDRSKIDVLTQELYEAMRSDLGSNMK